MIWTGAVIEGDRDPASCAGSGFPTKWMDEKGWMGTLSLPRVVTLTNHSATTDEGSDDVYLATPPLPELSSLRVPGSASNLTASLAPGVAATPLPAIRGRSAEVGARFALPPPSFDGSGWDVGVQLLWSENDEELTRAGVRDGSLMPGIDLWDEVSGDRADVSCGSVESCRAICGLRSLDLQR